MPKLSTGIPFLDQLLQGGYDEDIVTTIYGPSGSGKTNLCLIAAVKVAEAGKKVLFMDTEGGIGVERIKQVARDYPSILPRMIFFNPATFEEQKSFFEEIRDIVNSMCIAPIANENSKSPQRVGYLSTAQGVFNVCSTPPQNTRLEKPNPITASGGVSQTNEINMTNEQIGLIVIDSISMLYRLELGKNEDVYDTNAALGRQLAYLVEIARKKKIPVLITTQVYSDFDNRDQVKIVGGDLLKYGSKCLIELFRFANCRGLTLRKHRSLPEGMEAKFRIVQNGIEEVILQK